MSAKVDLSKFDNSWYSPEAGFVKRTIWYVINHVFINSYILPWSGIKILILRIFGAKVGKGCRLKPKVNIKFPWKLIVGDFVWIGESVWIDNLAQVKLGSHACLSQGSMILCGNHDYTKSGFDLLVKPVEIGEGAWLGAKSLVCPGVKVGSYSILTVYSLARKDLDEFSIYSGNPAQFVKRRVISEG